MPIDPQKLVPLMVNHFISTEEGKARSGAFTDFPEMSELLTQNQQMHASVLANINKTKK